MTTTTKRDKNRNNIITSPKDLENRYCTVCHVKLEQDQKEAELYRCPRCNVAIGLRSTEPGIKVRTTFPAFDPFAPHSRKHIVQAQKETLPRSEQFVRKRLVEKNKEEDNDPYLQMLKQNNQIRITNVEYYSHEDSEYLYD